MRRALVVLLLAAAVVAPELQAQQPPPRAERQMLERQFAQRLGQLVQRELRLDDAQMRRLQQVNQRLERRRRELTFEERDARIALRTEIDAGEAANQERVSALLDRLLRIQRERLDLHEAEQRELSAFLTPVQRARYFSIQDQLRRRMDEIRREQLGGDSARPRGGRMLPPPGARRRPPP